MKFWELRNIILTWLTPPFLRMWLCRCRSYGWPWWCQQQLDAAEERAKKALEAHKKMVEDMDDWKPIGPHTHGEERG